jgi:hypothetical protein
MLAPRDVLDETLSVHGSEVPESQESTLTRPRGIGDRLRLVVNRPAHLLCDFRRDAFEAVPGLRMLGRLLQSCL